MDTKARYANHYGLRGVFVWEIDADNFGGMYGKPAYTIASTISDALASGAGLEEAEILGAAADNADVEPKAPTCAQVNFRLLIITNSTCI